MNYERRQRLKSRTVRPSNSGTGPEMFPTQTSARFAAPAAVPPTLSLPPAPLYAPRFRQYQLPRETDGQAGEGDHAHHDQQVRRRVHRWGERVRLPESFLCLWIADLHFPCARTLGKKEIYPMQLSYNFSCKYAHASVVKLAAPFFCWPLDSKSCAVVHFLSAFFTS